MYNLGDFKENYCEEYFILGNWYVYNGKEEGLSFLVKRKDGHEVKEMYLPLEDMNNTFIFRKEKNENAKIIAKGIEEGQENKLIIQYGDIPSLGLMNKEKNISAKIITYYLKKL